MQHWSKRLLTIAAALTLGGCLWGPGKFVSDLTLRTDGSFVLDYRGELVLQVPDEPPNSSPWVDSMGRCRESGETEILEASDEDNDPQDPIRPCSSAELAELKKQYESGIAEAAASKQRQNQEMARALGLPGLDDESNRAFAAKLSKYAGWRSVAYRGKGVYDVDYHFKGRATQDFLFPALPDNEFVIPFIAIRRRDDGSVLVTAPALTGGAGALGERVGAAAASSAQGAPASRAEGQFTIITDGDILTNNSEDGAAPHAIGRQLKWKVGSTSNKVPEALIRLQ